MHQLKAQFSLLYYLACWLIALFSLWQCAQGHWIYVGVLMIWLPLPVATLFRVAAVNVGWGQEREVVLLLPVLLGLASVLLSGQQDTLSMLLALVGLFGVLLFLYIATAVPYGHRESQANKESLTDAVFYEAGEQKRLTDLSGNPCLVLFLHSANAYARMAVRQLSTLLEVKGDTLPADRVVVISVGQISWLSAALPNEVHHWCVGDGTSASELGLLLRGGAFPKGDALRPTLAVMDESSNTVVWVVAKNYRLPPCLDNYWPRVEKVFSRN